VYAYGRVTELSWLLNADTEAVEVLGIKGKLAIGPCLWSRQSKTCKITLTFKIANVNI